MGPEREVSIHLVRPRPPAARRRRTPRMASRAPQMRGAPQTRQAAAPPPQGPQAPRGPRPRQMMPLRARPASQTQSRAPSRPSTQRARPALQMRPVLQTRRSRTGQAEPPPWPPQGPLGPQPPQRANCARAAATVHKQARRRMVLGAPRRARCGRADRLLLVATPRDAWTCQ